MSILKVLVTGGCGYIGSHTAVNLINSGYEVVLSDNLSRSNFDTVDNITKITGKSVQFYKADINDINAMSNIFDSHDFYAVLHFAGFKSVSESVKHPFGYYKNNVCGTISLLEVMDRHDVRKIIFSSSASVYGNSETMPVSETALKQPLSPYASGKSVVEDIIRDLSFSNKQWNSVILRYFNPAGAHESMLIGENPSMSSDNLVPHIIKVALGEKKYLDIFGNDYNTKDGTGIRDYIHISDLADGHVYALKRLDLERGCEVYNLGTGKQNSVLDLINAFEASTGVNIPFQFSDRRSGDVAICYSDTTLANNLLGWTAKNNLNDICKSAWDYTLEFNNKSNSR